VSLERLASLLLADPVLRETLFTISARSVHDDVPALRPIEEVAHVDWTRALTISSALAGVPTESAQDGALRIAQGCLHAVDVQDGHRVAASVILERLGNRPALALAVRRETLPADAWNYSPAPLMLDVIRRRLELTIRLPDGRAIAANPSSARSGTPLPGTAGSASPRRRRRVSRTSSADGWRTRR
jgi:hypothetical protein